MERAGAKEGRNGATRRKGAKIPPINRKDSLPIFAHLSLILSLSLSLSIIFLHHLPPQIAAANRRSSPQTFFSYATRDYQFGKNHCNLPTSPKAKNEEKCVNLLGSLCSI
ncbi:hypothetical protein LXL04_004473 [Taraxacum kok-saghyz]